MRGFCILSVLKLDSVYPCHFSVRRKCFLCAQVSAIVTDIMIPYKLTKDACKSALNCGYREASTGWKIPESRTGLSNDTIDHLCKVRRFDSNECKVKFCGRW